LTNSKLSPDMPDTTPPTHARLTLMFVDVCDSTRLYEQLGDAEAQRKINRLLGALRSASEALGGRLVKEIGDESMLVFEHRDHALALARQLPALQQEHQMPCKTGIHTGEVIVRDEDVFGDAVNTAARIVALCTPGQVLLSKQTLDGMPAGLHPQTRPLPPISVRGKSQALQLLELAEEQRADYTQVIDRSQIPGTAEGATPTLTLTWQGGSRQFSGTRIGIGREPHNDLVLALPHISRVHLRIESQGNHWLIHDQSTNGTLLREQGAAPLLLRREHHRLLQAGSLHLTPSDPDDPKATIQYRIQPAC